MDGKCVHLIYVITEKSVLIRCLWRKDGTGTLKCKPALPAAPVGSTGEILFVTDEVASGFQLYP